ncbi:MAG TPA: polyprenyl synthetase family protein [Planctomycetota bacterium]|nr:polyprenyl synthetase family protein [Planctomycetota bacterium]
MSLAAEAAADLYAPIAPGLAASERALGLLMADVSASVTDLFTTVNRYGGKRLRPALVHLCAGLVGRPNPEHAALGAIVEALHLSSLLHDDVLDGADTRRRMPTLNALHGNEIPILLGDLLYARAFTLSLTLSTPDASRELAEASVAICRGEIEQSFLRFRPDLEDAAYFHMIADKTAALYGASCSLGAIYAGADAQAVATVRRFGVSLGMAFQIIDDCLDIVGDEGLVGKSLGTDLETGKMTLPTLRLCRRLKGEPQRRFLKLLQEPLEGSRREALRAAFDLDPIVAECQAEANGHIETCQAALRGFPDGPEKRSLSRLCGFVLTRGY